MPTAKFFYYPSSGGSLERIDLGENLSDLQVTPQRTVEDAYSLSGARDRISSGGILKIRFVNDRFTDGDLAYKLESLWTHLELGGLCGAVNDSAKAWAGYCESVPQRGDTELITGGNLYSAYTSGLAVAGAIAGGDIVCIQSSAPGIVREYCKVDSVSGDTITLDDPIRYDYPEGSTILVRHRDFFPAMRAPAEMMNTQIVTHDHRLSYTLDLTLEESPDAIEAVEAAGLVLSDTTFYGDHVLNSLESVLSDYRNNVRALGDSFASGITSRM